MRLVSAVEGIYTMVKTKVFLWPFLPVELMGFQNKLKPAEYGTLLALSSSMTLFFIPDITHSGAGGLR